jgi:hypothetical protein
MRHSDTATSNFYRLNKQVLYVHYIIIKNKYKNHTYEKKKIFWRVTQKKN